MSDKLHNIDIFTIIVATITFVVSTSWNVLMQNTIAYYFPEKDKSLTAQILYTIILTICLSSLAYYVVKYSDNLRKLINI